MLLQQTVLSRYICGVGGGMNTYNAIIEKDGDWYFGYALEVPGANGQGRTIEECKDDLAKAIELVLRDLEIPVLY